jgi:hypothetical protein
MIDVPLEFNRFSSAASRAEMAELVDALGSGPSGGNPMEVRVLFSAPRIEYYQTIISIWRASCAMGSQFAESAR